MSRAVAEQGAARPGRVVVGCSGWQYDSWRGRFYPAGLPADRSLAYYADRFQSVEINNSFYRLPEGRTFATWRDSVPASFVFSVKASRYLTHLKRLREPRAPLRLFFGRAMALGPRLGPVLYQLPGTLTFDADRLRVFLDALPASTHAAVPARDRTGRRSRRLRHVIEFRHPSWYRPDVLQWVRDAGACVCLHDMDGAAFLDTAGQPAVYVRFHGAAGAYRGSYDDRRLARWAERLTSCARAGRDVYAYFNNDAGAAAVRDAMSLRAKIAAAMEAEEGRHGRAQ